MFLRVATVFSSYITDHISYCFVDECGKAMPVWRLISMSLTISFSPNIIQSGLKGIFHKEAFDVWYGCFGEGLHN